MTYNEILVNMTACINSKKCGECSYKKYDGCINRLMTDALELILTQKFEIEKARAEAIKEFADRFDDDLAAMRDEYAHHGRPEYGLVCEVVHAKLLKAVRETVGVDNESKCE